MGNPKETTEFLLGEISADLKAVKKSLVSVKADMQKLKSESSWRKGASAALGSVGGVLGGLVTWWVKSGAGH